MRNLSGCCTHARHVGLFIVLGLVALVGVLMLNSGGAGSPDSVATNRSVDPVTTPEAQQIESALGRMLVADTCRRLGEDRVGEIARLFEEPSSPMLIPVPQLCFAPGTPEDVIAEHAATFAPRFNQIARWSLTANGSTGNSGDPITLTYSFPPDGTTIPTISGVSFPTGINDFHAWMNGIYGNQGVWQPIFEQVFDRWSEISGITYVFESNDDGADTNFSPGVLGVRGDLRICGKFLDGNSGVLAYNNFPDDGDMVFDSGDNFFNDMSSSSLRLRNVTAHEHGHGMGQLHVCPLTDQKLMEPIASTVFNGPQHDDIRNAQSHYGDPLEPDNSVGQATDLGLFAIPSTQTYGQLNGPVISFGATLSIDANSEQDYYRFSIASAAGATVTLTPIGTNYEDAQQACGGAPASCCSGTFTNSLLSANLGLEIIDTNGTSVLASETSMLAGFAEVATDVILDSAGDYYVRVFETSSPTQPQLYHLSIALDTVPFLPLGVTLPSGGPTELVPGVATSFDVEIDINDDTLVGGSALLSYRYDGGSYLTTPLASLGGNLYEATLPAANCDDVPEFFVQAEGSVTGVVTRPAGGAASPLSAIVGTFVTSFSDDGESDQGWASTGDASEGLWERGIPVNNDRGDPPADFDGSGQCWLTENDPNDANSDVDNGSAILTSAIIDISAFPDATIAYARWLDNTAGDSPSEDPMTVEVSDNGGSSWTTLEVVGPAGAEASGGWIEVEYLISDFVSVTSQFRIRFTVGDLINGSVVEAGLDAIRISGVECDDVVGVPLPPSNVNAADDASCDDVLVTWNASASADDYDVYRNSVDDSGTATLIATGVAATLFNDTTAVPGDVSFYWVQACNTSGCSGFSASDAGSRSDVAGDVTGLVATNESVCGAIDLTWDALAGATQYHVFRNLADNFGTATEIASVSPATTSLTDAAVDTGVSYFYWVVADNDCGSGGEGLSAEGVAAIRGDFNLDGFRNGLDVSGMVAALLGDASLVGCADLAAPQGAIDLDDLEAFVSVLTAP